MEKQIQELIKSAKWEIGYQEKEIVTRSLNLQVTPNDNWETGMLNVAKDKLTKAEYRLRILQEKLGQVEARESIVGFLTS